MSISLQEMQRQLHAYAMAEMRNRGLEEAAKMILQRNHSRRYGRDRYDAEQDVSAIRALKTDPSEHLSDWWGQAAQEQMAAAAVSNGPREGAA